MMFFVFTLSASDSQNSNLNAAVQGDTIKKTMPYTLPWDDMPVDLSFLYEKDKPAGSMVL
jgi:hypothetical protein